MANRVAVTGTNTDQAIDNGTFTVDATGWTLAGSGGSTSATHQAAPGYLVLLNQDTSGEASMIQEIVMSTSSPYYQYRDLTGTFSFRTVDQGVAGSQCYYKIYFNDVNGGTERVMASGGPINAGGSATASILATTSGSTYAWPTRGAGLTDGLATAGTQALLNKIYVKIYTTGDGVAQLIGIDDVSLEMNTMSVGSISNDANACSIGGTVTRGLTAPTQFKKSTGSTQAGTYKWFHDVQEFTAGQTDHYNYLYGTPQEGLGSNAYDLSTVEGISSQQIEGLAAAGTSSGSTVMGEGMTYIGYGMATWDQIRGQYAGVSAGGSTHYPRGNNDRGKLTISTSNEPTDGFSITINGTALTEGVHFDKPIVGGGWDGSDASSLADRIGIAIRKYIAHPDTDDVNQYDSSDQVHNGGIRLSYQVNNSAGTIEAVNILRGGADYNPSLTLDYGGTLTNATWMAASAGNFLRIGSGFATTDTWDSDASCNTTYGEVPIIREGTCDASSTDTVIVDTDFDTSGRGLDQQDNFWIGSTLEITEGTGAGKTATITDSDHSSRNLTFASIGVDLDTTSKYRVTQNGTRGIASIAISNAGSGYKMHIPARAVWNGSSVLGADDDSNVVTIYSPWSGVAATASTHICDFVGPSQALKWYPNPHLNGADNTKGTTRMPQKTLSTGEKIPYYGYTATHSKTLGASYQVCAAYNTSGSRVTAKASYSLSVSGDGGHITVEDFGSSGNESTASLYGVTAPYRGEDDQYSSGNGLTHQRNKYYERNAATSAVPVTSSTAANLAKFLVSSTSKTHDLTAFNTLASASTTYWEEKSIVTTASGSRYDGTAFRQGYVSPNFSGTFPLTGMPLTLNGNQKASAYFFGDVSHYLLDWEYQGDEAPTTNTKFIHLISNFGREDDGSDFPDSTYGGDVNHTLAATTAVFGTASSASVKYGISGEDGEYMTLLATLPSGSKPQGGSYTYEWITTKTELKVTPAIDCALNITAAGTPGGSGTYFEDRGAGGVDSGVSPVTVSVNNYTPVSADDTYSYTFGFGWLNGSTFVGLSTTDFQHSSAVSNAPSGNTTGADATGSGVALNSSNKYQLDVADSDNDGNIANQILLFNSNIATQQGHPSYCEYLVYITADNSGDCTSTAYSNVIRVYRDLSAATGSLGAVIACSSDSIMETESITFNALDSSPGNSDADGTSDLTHGHTYSWDFTYNGSSHNNEGSGLTVTRQFATSEVGTQTVRLLMTDFDGDTSAVTKTVTINDRVGVPDELVVQVYQSEALALEGNVSNALQAYTTTGKLTLADNYYIYRDYWYRIESNDAVDGFYIDWDDGEDNSPEKSNSQTILLDKPQFFTVVPHTYTKNSRMFPLVRAIKNGVYSKYYTNGVTAAQLAAQASDMSISINSTINDYSSLEGETLNNGNNEFSIVHLDSFGTEQTRFVPFLEPRNLPPVALLKTDRNTVYAGIDNSVIGTAGTAQEVYLDDDTGIAEASDGFIEADIVYEDSNGRIISTTWNTWANKKSAAIAVNKVLSLKLKSLLENTGDAANNSLRAGDRLFLKTDDADEVVAMVSHGSPYITDNQSQYYLIADGSESRTRASNNSIAGYYFTDGITNATTLGAWSSGTQVTDVYNSGTFAYTNSKRKFSYTFDETLYKHFKDPDDRYYDYEVLIKLQVKDNHTDFSGYDRYFYSKIQDYNNDVYNTSITPDFLKRNSSLRFYNSSSWANTSWTNEATALATLVDGTYGNGANNAFLLTDSEKKINRLFFQVKHASGFSLNTTTRDPKIRISIMYSGKNDAGGNVWKPVPFVTTTDLPDYSDTALYRSGVVSFNMPEDWVKTTASGMTWETFPPTDSAWDYSSYGLLVLMEVDAGTAGDIDIMSLWPYDDEYVQLITVQDPHHVSLSSVGVSQGIGFVRNAKNIDITDKLGRSTFKRMGVAASNLTFGGVQLAGDYSATYDALRKYQVNNTPVYYDLQRKDNSYIRFFGVITQMSEDYPVGLQNPKFGISMAISQIIEFTSAGVWSHDTPIALGGKVGDEPKYTT